MTKGPLLPRGVLSESADPPRQGPRFHIDWTTVANVAGVEVPLSELGRAAVEDAAGRYRQELHLQELQLEGAEQGISFGDLRKHAGKVATATERLLALLGDPKARALVQGPVTTEALQRLHSEAVRAATAATGGKGSNPYSMDLRAGLLTVMAARWHDAGGTVQGIGFYRAGAQVLLQVGEVHIDGPSRKKAVWMAVKEWVADNPNP
jgi:hypothetical protein